MLSLWISSLLLCHSYGPLLLPTVAVLLHYQSKTIVYLKEGYHSIMSIFKQPLLCFKDTINRLCWWNKSIHSNSSPDSVPLSGCSRLSIPFRCSVIVLDAVDLLLVKPLSWVTLKSSVCPFHLLVALISTCRPTRWTAATANSRRSPRRSSASRRPTRGALPRTAATASQTVEPASWQRPARTSSRCRPCEHDCQRDWAYSTKDCGIAEPTQGTLSPFHTMAHWH